jgi:phosphatidylglycerophosphate synthase
VLCEAEQRDRVLRAFLPHPKLVLPRVIPLAPGWTEALPGCSELLLCQADRVWTRALLEQMALALPEGRSLALACRSEALPAREEDFAGLLRVRRELLEPATEHLRGGLRALSAWAETQAPVFVRADGQYELARTEADVRTAEDLLLRSLVKPSDGWISRHINRKISLALSRLLCQGSIRPNHVTFVVLLLGLASGPLVASGFIATGGLLYYLAAVLDGCDGELARLKYLGSPLGTWFDTITDDLAALSYVAGLYWALHAQSGSPFWVVAGTLAVAGNVLAVALRYRLLWRMGTGDHQKLGSTPEHPARTLPERAVAWLKRVVFRTDFLPFAAFVLGVFRLPQVFAIPYPLGAIAAAVDGVRLTLNSGTHPASDAAP